MDSYQVIDQLELSSKSLCDTLKRIDRFFGYNDTEDTAPLKTSENTNYSLERLELVIKSLSGTIERIDRFFHYAEDSGKSS